LQLARFEVEGHKARAVHLGLKNAGHIAVAQRARQFQMLELLLCLESVQEARNVGSKVAKQKGEPSQVHLGLQQVFEQESEPIGGKVKLGQVQCLYGLIEGETGLEAIQNHFFLFRRHATVPKHSLHVVRLLQHFRQDGVRAILFVQGAV